MESTRIELRRATESDMSSVLHLIQLLAVYEREPDAVEVSEADLVRDFKAGKFEVFLADLDGRTVGMALFYERYSTWKGPYIHLEDLIVEKVHRGHGLGRMLLEAIIATAAERGCKRLGWEVLDWNTPAVEFYQKIGASIEKEWWQCRMYSESIQSFPYQYQEKIKPLLS
ncbi:MAG: GNAT family N-acetyltransferase [Flavobacteriia bacterium]|nr:GNAT family N-acetyltransferase [Flavobacteriia bacterium]